VRSLIALQIVSSRRCGGSNRAGALLVEGHFCSEYTINARSCAESVTRDTRLRVGIYGFKLTGIQLRERLDSG
jgi:hypothetical protein